MFDENPCNLYLINVSRQLLRRQLGLQSSEIIFTHYFKYLKLPRMCILIGMIILLRRSLDELLEQYQHPVTLKTASNPNVVALRFSFAWVKRNQEKRKRLDVFKYPYLPLYFLSFLMSIFYAFSTILSSWTVPSFVRFLEIFVVTGVSYIYVTCCSFSFSFAIS